MKGLKTYDVKFDNPLIKTITKTALNEVITAIKNTPNSGKLDVRGTMGLKGQVFKFDTITFDDSSTLMLESLEFEYVAIAVKELILDIKNPAFRAFLSRPIGTLEQQILSQLNGLNGINGQGGGNGGTIDRVGQPGFPGGSGTNGTNGGTVQLPQVFFFVQNFKFGTGATPSKQYFYLNFLGLSGGNGGNAGSGGRGGRGGNGDKGASGLIGCKEGGGSGGQGGTGGNGGEGGDGAIGGNGGQLFLYSPSPTMFDFSTANIEGGQGGIGGQYGQGGSGGDGGTGAASVGFCGEKPNGRYGRGGVSGSSMGDTGQAGQRGGQFVNKRDNTDLF